MNYNLIINATIMQMNDENTVIEKGYIAIKDGKIQAIGQMGELSQELYLGYRVIDCGQGYKRKVVLPGFIQSHVHTTQALGRGLADDVDLRTWTRKRIWPYEAQLTDEDVYISTMLSIAEMIKSGTTSFCEASGQRPDFIAQAVIDSGIKGTVCLSTMDIPGEFPECMYMPTEKAMEKNFGLVERWRGTHERVGACLNILNLFNSTHRLWQEFTKYSLKNNVLLQTHVAEALSEVEYTKEVYGLSPVRLLDKWGCLTPNLLAAHVVHVDEEEIELLRENDVKVMHLPAADLRIAGFAPIAKMLDSGISVSMGTNSPPCNNRMSIMDEMWLAGLMHKAIHNDPQAVPAKSVLRMATVNGSKALHNRDIGSLEVGKCADLTIMDFNRLCATPTHDLASTIVYQATSAVVDTVFVNGQILLEGGKLTTIDEAWLVHEAERRAQAIVKRAGIEY